MSFQTLHMTEAGRKPPPRRMENQDRVLCREMLVHGSSGLLLAVADGITNCPSGGSVANWLVAKHLAVDAIEFPPDRNPADTLRAHLEGLYVLFKEEFSAPEYEGMLNSGATLSAALLHGHTAECLWAGDSPIYHSVKTKDGYETRLFTRPDHDRDGSLCNCFGAYSPFSLHHCHLDMAPEDILTITSDGILCDDFAVSRVYSAEGFSKDALREMLRISRQGRYWDDLSVVAAQV